MRVFALVTMETSAIVGQDEQEIRSLRQERRTIDEAVKASRFAAAGQGSMETARKQRTMADQSLDDLRNRILPEERPLFERIESGWKSADALLEKMLLERGRAGAIFQKEILPVLTDLGQSLQDMEESRREISFQRVERIQQAIQQTRTQLLVFVLPLILVGIGLAWGMRRFLLRPLGSLREAADDVAHGHFDRPITLQQNDEMGDLIRQFNAMTSRLAEAEQMKKEFVSMVTHDIRTPLTVLRLYASLLFHTPDSVSDENRTRALEIIHRETLNLQALAEDLFDVTRSEAGAFRIIAVPTELAEEISAFLKPFERVAEEKSISFAWNVSSLPNAVVDGKRLGQAVRNLVTNAFKFAPSGGRVEVKGELRGEEIIIEVCDNGPGIPVDEQPHVFTRFYQVKTGEDHHRGGTGLGLAIVREIAHAHGGRAELTSEEGGLTRFRIALPFFPPPESGPPESDMEDRQ